MDDEKLRALTLYLSEAEYQALEREAKGDGRSGVSAQIRWILTQRRRQLEA